LLSAAGINGHYALNCALITWKTNRIIGRKDPLEYLKERVGWADEVAVASRLKTHLMPHERLFKAHYKRLEGEDLKSKLKSDFDQFMRERAELVYRAVQCLAKGDEPSLDSIWTAHN